MTDEHGVRHPEVEGPGGDDSRNLGSGLDDYAGLARLLDAVLDDAQSEATDDAFMEEALRRFALVRSGLYDGPGARPAPAERDEARSAPGIEGRARRDRASGARVIETRGKREAPFSTYTQRGHSELEQELFNVIEAVRSNSHTTPDFDNAQVLLTMIVTQARVCGIFTAEAAAYIESAKNRRHAGHLGDADRYARNALKISQAHEFRRSTILSYIELGMLSGDDGYLDHAAALAEPEDIELNARLSYAYARSKSQFDLLGAVAHIVQSEIMYEAAGDSYGLARAKAGLGAYLRLLGNFKAARRHLEEALELTRRGGFRRVEGYVLLDLGDIHRVTGREYEARLLLTSAKDLFSTLGHIGGRARALVGLALLEVRARKGGAAGVAYAEEACSLYERIDNVVGRGVSASTALALRCMGGALRDLDADEDKVTRAERLQRAGQCLDDAIAAYRALENRDGEALCLVGKAKLVARSDTPKAALPLAMQALDILAEMPGRFWQGTDGNVIEGFHSWCYRDTVTIALECQDYKGAQAALLAGEVDKELRELRAELVRLGGELGEAVHQLVLVELMMHSPAHEPNLGVAPPLHPKSVNDETRQRVLQKIESLDPHIAQRLRSN